MRRRSKVMIVFGLLLTGLLVVPVAVWWLLTEPLVWPVRKVAPAMRADAVRLRRDVETIVGLGPRDEGNPEGLDRVASHVRVELEAAGLVVAEQDFRVSDGGRFRNVVATLGPETRDVVVVGAHMDTCEPLPGADDNASGVAGLLELARLLSTETFSRRVELVAYTLEEPPFFRSFWMGSAVHARSLRDRQARVVAMVSLEMLGYFNDEPGSQELPLSLLAPFYPDRGSFIAVVGRLGEGGLVRRFKRAMVSATDLPVLSMNGPRSIPGVDFSDHLSYWDLGYPALMVTDTAFFRNGAYHTERDTPDRLDYGRMAKVVDGVAAAVREFASPPGGRTPGR